MSEDLTQVELFYIKNHVNYWLRFGNFSFEKNIDRRRAFTWFRPGQTFCYIRWWASEYGTQSWKLAILRTSVRRGNSRQFYPGITPGAEILLWVKGVTYVKRALKILDRIEQQDIDLCDVSPDYYRYLGQCITTRNIPHPYGIAQHRAYQKTAFLTWESG